MLLCPGFPQSQFPYNLSLLPVLLFSTSWDNFFLFAPEKGKSEKRDLDNRLSVTSILWDSYPLKSLPLTTAQLEPPYRCGLGSRKEPGKTEANVCRLKSCLKKDEY